MGSVMSRTAIGDWVGSRLGETAVANWTGTKPGDLGTETAGIRERPRAERRIRAPGRSCRHQYRSVCRLKPFATQNAEPPRPLASSCSIRLIRYTRMSLFCATAVLPREGAATVPTGSGGMKVAWADAYDVAARRTISAGPVDIRPRWRLARCSPRPSCR